MELCNTALKTAVRVIAALDASQDPAAADVEILRSLAPLLADEPLDFLAREIIQQALLRRSHFRRLSASGG